MWVCDKEMLLFFFFSFLSRTQDARGGEGEEELLVSGFGGEKQETETREGTTTAREEEAFIHKNALPSPLSLLLAVLPDSLL